MKINQEALLVNNLNIKFNKNIFLISGNDESSIKAMEDILILKLRKEGFLEIIRKENQNSITNSLDSFNGSLFTNSGIIIHSNPKDVSIEKLESFNKDNFAIILTYNNLKNSSPIKKSFDSHLDFISISCYELTRVFKKKFLDIFINNHNINMESDAYWFFLDNADNRYPLLMNELLKIRDFKKEIIKINEIRSLLSLNEGGVNDDLFFSILLESGEIIKLTNKAILSLSDTYIFLQKTKYIMNLCLISSDFVAADKAFPKYLFKQKKKFLQIFKKTNKSKLKASYKLIEKTEKLIRKNNNLYLIIIQRFLLNLKKKLL